MKEENYYREKRKNKQTVVTSIMPPALLPFPFILDVNVTRSQSMVAPYQYCYGTMIICFSLPLTKQAMCSNAGGNEGLTQQLTNTSPSHN